MHWFRHFHFLLLFMLVLHMPHHAWAKMTEPTPYAKANDKGIHILTVESLTHYTKLAMQDMGLPEDMKVMISGTYPATLYRHEFPFIPTFYFSDVDRTANTFRADVTLRTVKGGGQLGQTFEIKGRYEEWITIPVLSTRLTSQEVITDQDIIMESFPLYKIRRDTIMDKRNMLGQSPRRVVSAARPVRLSELMKPRVVFKNDLVTMVFRYANMELKATGFAMNDGGAGDIISVRNSDSHRTVKARIDGAGIVTVFSSVPRQQPSTSQRRRAAY